MKKYAYLLLLTLLVPVVLVSCLSDDEVETDDYCYISGFTLGSMKRTLFTLSVDGEDSVYTTTFQGSLFPMTIDQRALTIENQDSLPIRTRVDAVLVTITYEGALTWRKQDHEEDDTLWNAYSSSDSLDFTSPIEFASIASNGNSYRTYTAKLNVHKQKADSTVWNKVGIAEPLNSFDERKALCLEGQIMVLGEDADGSVVCALHPMETSGEWQSLATNGAEGADLSTLQMSGGTLFLSTSSGEILQSSNALDWVSAGYPVQDGLKLVAASPSRLYALLDGELVSSDGGDWTAEELDDDAAYLPTEQVFGFSYTLPDGQNRLMIIGQRDDEDDTSCMVWAKAWTSDEEGDEPWMFYVPNAADKRRCPIREQLNVVAYDDGFLTFGGKTSDGQHEAMDSVLYSADHGITWRPYDDNDMDVDTLITQAAAEAKHITSAVDDEQYLWLFLDSEVWRGRINRLGFLRKDPD
ncbi:MAG: DUF6242 domain-containing protein [Prevotellaceae bacterium]|nr:DUF6242 domain-containing protein [Prevotellaceae bacterium]